MMNDLRISIIEMAQDIRLGITGAVRHNETNKEWGEKLKLIVQSSLNYHLTRLVNRTGSAIHIVNMPYTAETGSGRGEGRNPIVTQQFIPFVDNEINEEMLENNQEASRQVTNESCIYCLVDVIDGTWNANCGLTFSCSTTLAFTDPIFRSADQLTLGDFHHGFIIPYFGAGVYIGQMNYPTFMVTWDGTLVSLTMNAITDVSRSRLILDLFTEEDQESLEQSIAVIGPVLKEWCDFGRFYGAGVEIAALFGYRRLVPGFAAYVAAHQKMDNIAPTYAMVLGAGGIVSDWWGNPIMTKKLSDRIHVIMSANQALHQNLVTHLSKRPQP